MPVTKTPTVKKKTPVTKGRVTIHPKPSPPKKRMPPKPEKPVKVKSEAHVPYANKQEQYAAKKDNASRSSKHKLVLGRDIAPLPYQRINWERRLKCKESLKLFAETYMPRVFYYGWSQDQLECLERAEKVCGPEGGMFSLSMPRGGGKTAICRAAVIWAIAYGLKKFIFLVGATEPKSTQSLDFIKTNWFGSTLLRNDFPEISYPIFKTEGRWQGAGGQLFRGQPTFLQWGATEVRMACLQLPPNVVEEYQKYDPDSVIFHPGAGEDTFGADTEYLRDREMDYVPQKSSEGIWLGRNAGIILRTSGIDGSIRGDALVNPITLEQPRPDLVILDDVQKDAKADSPLLCEKLIRLIDGAVAGLAGPGEHINVLMPCTVIREGDVADTFLDPMKKPEWMGKRCAMVTSWPLGLNDEEITNESEEGRAWNMYAELYRESYHKHKDFHLATDYYRDNREMMDRGFNCSWPDRYHKGTELSPQQHAMNLRIKLGPMFAPEYQNRGRKLHEEGEIMITADQLAEKTIEIHKGFIPVDTQYITCLIDVQTEILWYAVLAVNENFDGVFTEYGTWPDTGIRYFTKSQTRSWAMLTTEFYKTYPDQKNKVTKNSSGHHRAPLDAKLYHALQKCTEMLLAKEYHRVDAPGTPMKINKIGIDTRWGEASEVIKRFIKESRHQQLIPYYGASMPPTHRQYEEYTPTKGWLFENQRHTNVKDPMWCVKPHVSDGMFYMVADVDRAKDFLFKRLSTPPGGSGSISLFQADSLTHELFAKHICNSEYPEPVTARGMTKNKWTEREGIIFDNDYLDCAAGCMSLASLCGASVKTTDVSNAPVRRKLSQIHKSKRGKS